MMRLTIGKVKDKLTKPKFADKYNSLLTVNFGTRLSLADYGILNPWMS